MIIKVNDNSVTPEFGSYRIIKKFAIYKTISLIDGNTVKIICDNYYVLQEYIKCNPAFGYSDAWKDRKYALNANDFSALNWTMVQVGINPKPAWSLR